MLDEGTAATAARGQEIGDEIALEVVFLTDVGTLHEHRNPVETDTHRGPEPQALYSSAYDIRKIRKTTHSGVDGIVTFEVGVLSSAMVGLAKCHTGNATRDGTCVDCQ